MALPTPPDYTSPIPNNPFYSLLEWYIPGPYSPLVVGAGLNIDPDGVISATGGGGVSSLIAGPGLSVNSSTGNVTITNTGVTSLVAGTGINVSAASGTVTIDATTFGTVTGITTGAGLTGGPITVTGTIALAPSGATAGIYTSPTITIDTYGRILTATSNTVVNAINVTAPLTIAGTTNPTLGVGAGTTATAGVVQLSDAVNDTSSTCAASTAAVALAYTAATQAIPKTCITGKGALVTGSAASTPVAIPAGADGQVLYACSGSATGLCWSSVPAVAQATPTTLGTLKGCTIGDGLLTSMTALGSQAELTQLQIKIIYDNQQAICSDFVLIHPILHRTTTAVHVGIGLDQANKAPAVLNFCNIGQTIRLEYNGILMGNVIEYIETHVMSGSGILHSYITQTG